MLNINNLLTQGSYLYTLIDEYHKHIKRYKNHLAQSVPVRYISLNTELSTFDKQYLDSVYQVSDSRLNGLVYDVYELVPTIFTSPFNIELLENELLTGIDFNTSPVNITLFGILDPSKIHLNDFVQFYSDYFNNIVFQVYNIRTPVYTNITVPIFELDLTPSTIEPDKLFEKVRINKMYVYDLSLEKFIPYEYFNKKMKIIDFIEKYLSSYLNTYFYNTRAELYCYTDSNKCLYPYLPNHLIYEAITDVNYNFFRIFNIKIPTKTNSVLARYITSSDDINNNDVIFVFDENPLSLKFTRVKTIENISNIISAITNILNLDDIYNNLILMTNENNYIERINNYITNNILTPAGLLSSIDNNVINYYKLLSLALLINKILLNKQVNRYVFGNNN